MSDAQAQTRIHDELLDLYGRPISDAAVLNVLARHGFKVPKTWHKSAHGAGREWLVHKKNWRPPKPCSPVSAASPMACLARLVWHSRFGTTGLAEPATAARTHIADNGPRCGMSPTAFV